LRKRFIVKRDKIREKKNPKQTVTTSTLPQIREKKRTASYSSSTSKESLLRKTNYNCRNSNSPSRRNSSRGNRKKHHEEIGPISIIVARGVVCEEGVKRGINSGEAGGGKRKNKGI